MIVLCEPEPDLLHCDGNEYYALVELEIQVYSIAENHRNARCQPCGEVCRWKVPRSACHRWRFPAILEESNEIPILR